MVTSFAAGQEKHAASQSDAQKLDLLIQTIAASACLRKHAENAICAECASMQPYPGLFCPSGQKPHMMK
jgi:hypothetical protein